MAATARKTAPPEGVVIPMKRTDPKLLTVGSITHSIEEITPQMAEKMLEKNTVNRPVSRGNVNSFSRSMQGGQWMLSVIWLDADGNILDGQHRLLAVANSGTKQKFLIIRNAPQAQQDVLDTGKKRSIGDVLHFKGEENAQQLGAVARLVNLVITNRIGQTQVALSNEEILGTIEMYPDLRLAAEVSQWSKYNRLTTINPAVIGAGWWLIAQRTSLEEATQFINRLCTLVGEKPGSPMLALNKRVSEIRRKNQHFPIRDQIFTLIKVWNYDATGRAARSITTTPKEGSKWTLPEIRQRQYQQESSPELNDFGFQFPEGEADDDDE